MSLLRACGRRIIELEKRIAGLEAKPDASAGLIEAAEIAEGLAKEFERRHDELKRYSLDNDHRWIDFYPRIAQGCEEVATAIRARAADRSRK